MAMRSLALALATTLALTASAHSVTFEDGFNVGWAEQHGPQFLFPWSASDIAVIRRALDKMKDEHDNDPSGFDDYWMGRRARILATLDTNSFIVLGSDGAVFRWMSLPETILVGTAVSRDRYREAPMEEPEAPSLVARLMNLLSISAFAQYANPPKMVPRLDGLAENVDRYIENVAAIALFKRIEQAQPFFRGGAG